MKKIISMFLIFLLMFSLCVFTVSAAEEDLFYYDNSDKEFNELLPEIVELQTEWTALELVDQGELEYSRDENRNKIEIRTDEMFCAYDWTSERLKAFFGAENKRDYLNGLPVTSYEYPVYYKGERLHNIYERIDYQENHELKYVPAQSTKEGISSNVCFQQMEPLTEYLSQKGFGDYVPLLTIRFEDLFWYCYATKNE